MSLRSLLLILAGMLSLTAISVGHHSVSSAFFLDQSKSIEGNIVEIVLRNPHASISIASRDNSGRVTRWTADWLSLSDLGAAGITVSSLAVGDSVRLTGAPARSADEHHLLLTEIVRASDGWKWAGVILKPAAPTIVVTR